MASTTIARSIRIHARARGLTIAELERSAGLSHQSFYDRLRGKIDWRLGELEAVAQRLDVGVADLLTDPLARGDHQSVDLMPAENSVTRAAHDLAAA